LTHKLMIVWQRPLLFFLSALLYQPAFADKIVRELGKENGEPEPYVFPYTFVSQAMGTVVGVAGGVSGLPQEQNSLVTTALVSNEGASAVYLFFNDYQFARQPQLFLDVSMALGNFPQQRAYLDLTPPGINPPAGSNDSSPDNFFDARGLSNWLELDFKYVLDIGNARHNPINLYTLSNGLLVGGASGGEVFNPFKSGRSYIQTSLFYHNRDYEVQSNFPLTTSGVGLSFIYDNTDFPVNPSKGSIVRGGVKYDPGFSGRDDWSIGEIELSKFILLPNAAGIRQQVIALNFWTANTFSDSPPPHYFGITLGGLYRLRAYPIERFHDNSAIYYAAEYRVIPKSNIFKFFDFINIPWWEFAFFYETGRVAPEWDLQTLHDSMKQDIGLSFRLMMNNDIGRLDMAFSNEDTILWLMYGHPF